MQSYVRGSGVRRLLMQMWPKGWLQAHDKEAHMIIL